MADSPGVRVRPTIRFLRDLGLSFPRLQEPLWRIPHPLVAHMQKTPDEVLLAPARTFEEKGQCLLLLGASPELTAELDRHAVPVITLAADAPPPPAA